MPHSTLIDDRCDTGAEAGTCAFIKSELTRLLPFSMNNADVSVLPGGKVKFSSVALVQGSEVRVREDFDRRKEV
jgi:hypothetical protein